MIEKENLLSTLNNFKFINKSYKFKVPKKTQHIIYNFTKNIYKEGSYPDSIKILGSLNNNNFSFFIIPKNNFFSVNSRNVRKRYKLDGTFYYELQKSQIIKFNGYLEESGNETIVSLSLTINLKVFLLPIFFILVLIYSYYLIPSDIGYFMMGISILFIPLLLGYIINNSNKEISNFIKLIYE